MFILILYSSKKNQIYIFLMIEWEIALGTQGDRIWKAWNQSRNPDKEAVGMSRCAVILEWVYNRWWGPKPQLSHVDNQANSHSGT